MRCRHLRICGHRSRTRKSTGWCLKNTSPYYRPCAASIRSIFSMTHGNIPRCWSLIRDLRSQHYDFAIDFQGLLKTAALTFLSGARTRLGFSRDLVREFPAHWFYNRTQPKPQGQFHVLQLNRMLAGVGRGCSRFRSARVLCPRKRCSACGIDVAEGRVDGLCGDQSRRRLVHQEVESCRNMEI